MIENNWNNNWTGPDNRMETHFPITPFHIHSDAPKLNLILNHKYITDIEWRHDEATLDTSSPVIWVIFIVTSLEMERKKFSWH